MPYDDVYVRGDVLGIHMQMQEDTCWVGVNLSFFLLIEMGWMQYDDVWVRRDVLGIHKQKQEGLYWVGANVPAGRFYAEDYYDFARIADE